jgi:cystathionine beta-lyase/cystathionine gamma-synthase
MNDGWRFDTRAVHAGRDAGPLQDPDEPRPEGRGTPVVPGIQPSSSYYFRRTADLDRAFDDPHEGYVYARHGSPTVGAFAQAVADLEGAGGAVAFSSGMAAIHAALLAAGIVPGDAIVASRDLYGATQTLLTGIFGGQGVRAHLADATDLDGFVAAIRSLRPKVVYVETISNPLLRIPDIGAIASAARAAGSQLIVDNTFASPYLCRPIEWGAGAVVHSATKYLGGHGDLTAGVVATRADLLDQVRLVSRLVGGMLGAFDAWLALRGLRTLTLRLERQCANALAVAERLARHPRVAAVNYPGLPRHPQHALAQRLFGGRGFGGELSF